MNKTALKNFAIYSRKKLIKDVTLKASLVGVTSKGIEKPLEESDDLMTFNIGLSEPYKIEKEQVKQRHKLVKELKRRTEASDYNTAFEGLIEEVAYTWFNRIIALRFMEVNDYMPDHIRVLSSGKESDNVPEIVTEVFNSELEFSQSENDLIVKLKESGTTKNLDELFNFLFIKTCNNMHEYLSELFEKSNDYTELLYNVSFVDTEGVVYKLLSDVDEADFDIESKNGNGQVEIIGWLYQYYNDERKNEVINIYKGTIKKEDIPAATQLFTTDWVVRYMVDNSLAKYWIERNPNSKLAEKLQFFFTNKKNEINYINEKIEPQDLTFFDPCMGSGHILVYAFNVLMEIYKECGYTERDAAQEIIKHNLYGLDIDDRAYQLSYFALMMKARSYDRRFLKREIKPNISSTLESNVIDKFYYEGITTNKGLNEIGEYLVSTYRNAKELGTLISVDTLDYDRFNQYLDDIMEYGEFDLISSEWKSLILPVIKRLNFQAKIMSKKYTVVCTNPPYMNKLQGELKKFVIGNYKDFGKDLFSTFIRRNFDYCKKDGYLGFMTPFVWMFIKTYEQLREYIINNKSITTLIQMEYSAFEEATVPICSFVLKNGEEIEKGLYFKLSDFKGGMEVQKEKVLEAIQDKECGYFYETEQRNFEKIPGSPIAYWASNALIKDFEQGLKMDSLLEPKVGLQTGDNNRFLRQWFEVKNSKIFYNAYDTNSALNSQAKWFPYNKGGERRQWYGNYDYVVNWENDGVEIKNFKDKNGKQRSVVRNPKFYFKEAITWSDVTSGKFSIRYRKHGGIHDVTGMSAFSNNKKNIKIILGLMTTNISNYIFDILNPTLHLQIGNFSSFPILECNQNDKIIKLVDENIMISKIDWNYFETSWDFIKYPLLKETSLKLAYSTWKNEVEERFLKLKSNEEELNRIFIDIYGLQDEITPEVRNKDITVARIYDAKAHIPESMKGNNYVLTKQEVIKQFISYAVGCMFGRYSLDVEGLAYAGGDFYTSKYKTFIPDRDNCIPITDNKYFEDDIVTIFVEFVKAVYGVETLEENIDFIADALGSKGNSRDIIRNYFLKDFFKDHCKMYKKRPIYWLYDSGKENGFKALVYLHRYTDQTTGIVRANYLHELQKYYRATVDSLKNELNSNTSAHSRKVAEDGIKKIEKQLDECKDFDEKMGHLANERISIDLDDGVKVNYEKVQTDRDGKVLQVLAKIK